MIRTKGRIFLSLPEMLRGILQRSESALRRSMKRSVETHQRESRLGLPRQLRWASPLPCVREVLTTVISYQPSTTRTGPSSPFLRGEISPLFKERVTEALRSSSPTTPTPPMRIRRGKPRARRDVQGSFAGPSSSPTPTPPSSPTSRNTHTAGEEKISPLEFYPRTAVVNVQGTPWRLYYSTRIRMHCRSL